MSELTEKIKEFSTSPGVYLMKGVKGEVLYVGKAKNLKARVTTYFRADGHGDGRYQIKFLMKRVADVEVVLTQNEKEALLLENTLIKKHKPKYNVFLKDDKSYPSLKITQHEFPRLVATRNVIQDGSDYYGPYTSAFSLYEIVNFIQNNFRLRNCSDHDFANRSRACLQYQIKRCNAPCVGYEDKQHYQQMVQQIRLFLEGKNKDLEQSLHQKMQEAAEQEKFEEAAYYRDLIASVKNLLEKQQVLQHEGSSMDVWAYAVSEEQWVVVLLQVRHGSLSDKREFQFARNSFEEIEESFSSFLLQYYKEASLICQQIVLPELLKDEKALEEILSEVKDKKVKFYHPEKGDGKKRLQLAQQNADEKLKLLLGKNQMQQQVLKDLQALLSLKKLPQRMECFDISNLAADSAVGSCVCFMDGKADKNNYRRFKIKDVVGQNDFAMHYEMMKRRLSHPEWGFPDLMIIDGGKGQLNAALQALQESGVTTIEMVSLAKEKDFQNPQLYPPLTRPSATLSHGERGRGEGGVFHRPERVFLPGQSDPIVPDPQSEVCKLLVRIRDEAHRFGIEYHRKMRGNKGLASLLDLVEGLGPKRKALLLKQYGSLSKIFSAGVEAVHQETKIQKEILENLFQILSQKFSAK